MDDRALKHGLRDSRDMMSAGQEQEGLGANDQESRYAEARCLISLKSER